ncbi:MAG: TonB-dependent receptor [Pseudomonadota bacterium]
MKRAFTVASSLALLAGTTLWTAPTVLSAQENDDDDAIDLIVVSARKRDEVITDIPIAITAFDAAKIESLGLQSIIDLPAVTPGFVYEKFAGLPGRFDNSPRFRGISVNSLAPSRQTASVFVDGIFVSNGVQGIGLEDIERVEIIKGPQSAYFGRLTFGGAINYVTRTPGDEFKGRASVFAGDYDDYRANVSIEGPLISDVMSGRLTAAYNDKGGHYLNESTGDELGQERTSSIGGTLYITPTDNLEIKIRGFYYENDDGAPAYAFAGLNDHNCGPLGGPDDDTTICGDVPIRGPDLNLETPAGLTNALTNNLIALNGSNLLNVGLDRESTRLSAQFNYDFGNNLVLSGLFGINDEEVRLLRDADDTADFAYVSYSGRKFEDQSFELRLSGTAFEERMDWSVGFNMFEQEFVSNGEFIVPPLGFFAFGGGEPGQEDIETTGIFGSVSYAINDAWRVTLEGRSQEDDITDDGDITDGEPGNNVTFDNFLPRAIVEWTPADGTLLYASYSEGNLPGGFNGEVALLTPAQLAELRSIESGAGPEFEEETLANHEIGWKQQLPNGRGVVTLAAFFMERTDQTFRRADIVADATQPTGFNQVDYFINAGESEVTGFEFDGEFVINDNLTLEATLAYIDSEFKVFNSGVHNELFGTEDASGKRGERFPEWSGSVSALFGGEISAEMSWFGRADLFYQGERFADEGNLTTAPGGSQINLRGGVTTDRYRAEIFVTNLTDDDTPTAINRFRDLSFATPLFDFSTFGYQIGLRDRRQVGIRASVNF